MNIWSLPSLSRSLSAALRDLREPSPAVRASAINDLTRHHDSPARPQVVASLLQAFADESPRVRAAAAQALSDVAEPSAVRLLLVGIEDENSFVRQMALQALGQIGDRQAASRVFRALTDPRPEVRFQAVIAYPKIVPEEAESVLLAAITDADAGIRYVALRSLEERVVTTEPFAPTVRQAAMDRLEDDHAPVRIAAALLLAHVGDVAGAAILVAVVDGSLVAEDPEDEAAAVEAVGRLDLQAARGGLVRRVFGPGRWFREHYTFLARISLAQLGHREARASIVRDLNAWSRSRRTLAVMAIGRAGLVEAEPLLQGLEGQPDRIEPSVVTDALQSLRAFRARG